MFWCYLPLISLESKKMVPGAGLEPAHSYERGILKAKQAVDLSNLTN
jgi:hypothetical protein